jgi:hypothetical protein
MKNNSSSPKRVTPLPAPKALESYFLEARAKLLDLAGILDRIGRGSEASTLSQDARIKRMRQALEILGDASGGRADRIQQVFSLDYDPSWKKPRGK